MNDAPISRRSWLKAASAVGLAGVTGLAGCQGSSDTATGTLATAVKDAPGDISDFERCVVTIDGFWLKDSTDDSTATATGDGVTEQDEDDVDQSDERTYHEYDQPQEADLVQLQDGATQLIDDREVEVGTYAFLQLDVSTVDGTLASGDEAGVGTPGNAPLQFKQEFDVRDGERTTFTADFTPVKRGQTGQYLLQPVATGIDVSYADVTPSE
jgi:hypothetical protein